MVLLEKDILKICTKFTGEHPSGSAVLIHLQRSNFTEITLTWVFSNLELYCNLETKFLKHSRTTIYTQRLLKPLKK